MSDDRSFPSHRTAVLVVIGASGAGKTTLVRRLESLGMPGVRCFYTDDELFLDAEEIATRFRDGEEFQAWVLAEWLMRIHQVQSDMRVAVLDTQARPAAIRDAFERHGIATGGALLVHCDRVERNRRLRGRNQPELANAQMDSWAEYLRRQAEALGVPVIDTTVRHEADCLAQLCGYVATYEPQD